MFPESMSIVHVPTARAPPLPFAIAHVRQNTVERQEPRIQNTAEAYPKPIMFDFDFDLHAIDLLPSFYNHLVTCVLGTASGRSYDGLFSCA
jgi:hypothetical protein